MLCAVDVTSCHCSHFQISRFPSNSLCSEKTFDFREHINLNRIMSRSDTISDTTISTCSAHKGRIHVEILLRTIRYDAIASRTYTCTTQNTGQNNRRHELKLVSLISIKKVRRKHYSTSTTIYHHQQVSWQNHQNSQSLVSNARWSFAPRN
jgi:hypothetical protein